MPQSFYITHGDRGRVLEAALGGTDGTRLVMQNLEGQSVRFRMKPEGAATSLDPYTIDAAAEIVSVRGWRVRYTFDLAPFPAVGRYLAKFVAIIDGREVSFPSAKPPEDFIRIVIGPDL